MEEIYGEPMAQRLADVVWIRRCAAEGWVVFTKDKKLRKRSSKEFRAICRHGVKVFSLPKGGMKESEQIARFVDNSHRIAQRARKRGPYIVAVMPKTLEWYYKP